MTTIQGCCSYDRAGCCWQWGRLFEASRGLLLLLTVPIPMTLEVPLCKRHTLMHTSALWLSVMHLQERPTGTLTRLLVTVLKVCHAQSEDVITVCSECSNSERQGACEPTLNSVADATTAAGCFDKVHDNVTTGTHMWVLRQGTTHLINTHVSSGFIVNVVASLPRCWLWHHQTNPAN